MRILATLDDSTGTNRRTSLAFNRRARIHSLFQQVVGLLVAHEGVAMNDDPMKARAREALDKAVTAAFIAGRRSGMEAAAGICAKHG